MNIFKNYKKNIINEINKELLKDLDNSKDKDEFVKKLDERIEQMQQSQQSSLVIIIILIIFLFSVLSIIIK